MTVCVTQLEAELAPHHSVPRVNTDFAGNGIEVTLATHILHGAS